jgi:hypothetical protein
VFAQQQADRKRNGTQEAGELEVLLEDGVGNLRDEGRPAEVVLKYAETANARWCRWLGFDRRGRIVDHWYRCAAVKATNRRSFAVFGIATGGG